MNPDWQPASISRDPAILVIIALQVIEIVMLIVGVGR